VVDQGVVSWLIQTAPDGDALWTVWGDATSTRVLATGKEATRPRAQGKVATIVFEYVTRTHKPVKR
jgi:hypothetical protein